jgi:8-oxo-dGTP pyrophosphatase MutT (NUDIX family)
MYPADQVRFRPAAYGLFVHAGRILLGRSRFTGKWDIPGGGVEAWETLEDGVAREFLEETGVRVCASKLVDFRESFIAFGHHPFHSLRYYYAVAGDPGQTLTPDLTELSSVDWVGLDAIRLEECAPGDFALIERIVKDKGERD